MQSQRDSQMAQRKNTATAEKLQKTLKKNPVMDLFPVFTSNDQSVKLNHNNYMYNFLTTNNLVSNKYMCYYLVLSVTYW